MFVFTSEVMFKTASGPQYWALMLFVIGWSIWTGYVLARVEKYDK